jgi:hypothetical protein
MRLSTHVFVTSTKEIVFGYWRACQVRPETSRSEAKPLKLASVTLDLEIFCSLHLFHDPILEQHHVPCYGVFVMAHDEVDCQITPRR